MKEYLGYCKVNISPVRAENKDESEMVTQLLFGEIVQVHEIKGTWCKITVFNDNYPGWVDLKQIGLLTEKEANRWMDGVVAETKLIRQIQTPWGKQWITRGSYVSPQLNGAFHIGNDHFFFFDEPKSKTYKSQCEMALEYLNAPYLWGGKTSFGIDCSGLTQMVFRFFDINLPRDASQQAEHGREITFAEKEPNDLAFFSNESGKIIHVGIVLPENKIIHASGQVRIDTLTSTGIYNEDKKENTHSLYSLRRL